MSQYLVIVPVTRESGHEKECDEVKEPVAPVVPYVKAKVRQFEAQRLYGVIQEAPRFDLSSQCQSNPPLSFHVHAISSRQLNFALLLT